MTVLDAGHRPACSAGREPTHRGRAWPRVGIGAAFGALWLWYIGTAFARPHFATDTISSYTAAWQLASHGTLHLDALAGHVPWLVPAAHHHLASNRFPGATLFAAPFYLLAPGGEMAIRGPAVLAAATATTLAVAAFYLLVRRLAGNRVALAAAVVAALATSTWTVSSAALWTHGPDQFWLAAAMLALASSRQWLAGLALGAAALTRPHLAVAAGVIGCVLAVRQRSWRPLARIGAGSLTGVVVLLAYNHVMFGGWSVLGGYAEAGFDSRHGVLQPHRVVDFAHNIAGALVSPERGLLVLSPFLLLLLPGLRSGWRVAPGWVRAATLGGLAYTVAQLWVIRFDGGNGFYSYRTTIEPLTLAAPLLVLCWTTWTSRTRLRRTAFGVLLAASFAIQALGALALSRTDLGTTPDVHPWTRFLTATAAEHAGALGTLAIVVIAALLAWLLLRRPQAPHPHPDPHPTTRFAAIPAATRRPPREQPREPRGQAASAARTSATVGPDR